MTKRFSTFLFMLALALYFFAATFQDSPGYMDADYHLYMGQRIVEGFGFTEDILWNYLDNPIELPHPSHTYWSPLPSIIAAGGIRIFSNLETFQAARIPFILMAASVPILTGQIAFQLAAKRSLAKWAAFVVLFSPFYLPYLITTDSFMPSMFLGGLFFLMFSRSAENRWPAFAYLSLGLLSGLLYLTRAEGLIWLLFALGFALARRESNSAVLDSAKRDILPILLGFFLIATPWLWRNAQAFGSLFPPGGIRALWLTNYNDLFAYPPDSLTMTNWLAKGLAQNAGTVLWALGQNALSTIVILSSILLFPFTWLGFWTHRNLRAIQIAILAWGASLLLMSLFFPFPGVRGGFFHAGVVLQPLFWALSAIGLYTAVSWASEKRNWPVNQAWQFLGGGTLLILLVLSFGIFRSRVIGLEVTNPVWDSSAEHYKEIAAVLSGRNLQSSGPILVNNPPGFALQSGMAAIVIPNGNEATLLAVSERFGASIIILEENHPPALEELYLNPRGRNEFAWLASIDDSHILQILKK